LIKKILVVNYDARPTAQRALEHPWFKKFKEHQTTVMSEESPDKLKEDRILSKNIVKQLRKYRGETALKKAAMNILVKMLDSKDIETLKNTFMELDTANSGYITSTELRNALQHDHFNIP
jgi:calcium-dependent protein kinase